ncbi:hypothetical protein MP228_010340 [Amoeboaphelidium protococcarum]|nr:hypothetical protein MP228_010340 [Amoeboaphelidium protococcarum]
MNRQYSALNSSSPADASLPTYSQSVGSGEHPMPQNCDPCYFAATHTLNEGSIVSMQQQQVIDAPMNGHVNLCHPHLIARPQQTSLIDQISCLYCQKYNTDQVFGKRCEHQKRVLNSNRRFNKSRHHDTESTRQQNIDDGDYGEDDEDQIALNTLMQMRANANSGQVPEQIQTTGSSVRHLSLAQQREPLIAMIPQQPAFVPQAQSPRRRIMVNPFFYQYPLLGVIQSLFDNEQH